MTKASALPSTPISSPPSSSPPTDNQPSSVNMKASIKFRDEQQPLLRAKIPINILNFPFQSGVVAGEWKDFSLNLSTYFDSGPSLKVAYRPNDSDNPLSFIVKTGIGHLGSPIRSRLTMSAEFNLIGSQNPSFFVRFKPDFSDFSVNRLISSAIVKKLRGKPVDLFGSIASLFPATLESKTSAGLMVNSIVRGTELTASTVVPLTESAVVNFRWGLRVPRRQPAADNYNAVARRRTDRTGGGGYRMPRLVMNKITLLHVANAHSKLEKVGPDEEYEKVADTTDLRSDIAAGNMEILPESHRSKCSSDGSNPRGEKTTSEAMGEGKEGLKIA